MICTLAAMLALPPAAALSDEPIWDPNTVQLQTRSRGMVFYRVLELAVAHTTVRYKDLIATKRPRSVQLVPPRE